MELSKTFGNLSKAVMDMLPQNCMDFINEICYNRKDSAQVAVLCIVGGISSWYIFYRKSRNSKLNLKQMNVFKENTYFSKVVKVRNIKLITVL